jgi:hypothetical protein
MKHRLDWDLYTPPTFTHLHQRQPARSEAAAMMVLFPALARATAALDSEATGADGERADESAATWVQVVTFQVPK